MARKSTGYMVVAGGDHNGMGGDGIDISTKSGAILTARKLLRQGWAASGVTVWKMYDDDTSERVVWSTVKKRRKQGKYSGRRPVRSVLRDLAEDLRIATANYVAAKTAQIEAPSSNLAAANVRDAHEVLYDVQKRIAEQKAGRR
jgi:hypothetical protein